MKSRAESDPAPEVADLRWMRRALALARRGGTDVYPNPQVGAVLMKDGICLGAGWHRAAGGPHAEIEALLAAGYRTSGSDPKTTSIEGATLYVTLEPCNHHGLTPPCSDAVLAAGIRRVVVAMRDPNPEVSGGGIERLRNAGLTVSTGCLESAARALNRQWVFAMEHGRPRFTGVVFRTLDGVLFGMEADIRMNRPHLDRILSRIARFFVHRSGSVPLPTQASLQTLQSSFAPQQVHGVLLERLGLIDEASKTQLLDALVVVQLSEFSDSTTAVSSVRETHSLATIDGRFDLMGFRRFAGIPVSVYEVRR